MICTDQLASSSSQQSKPSICQKANMHTVYKQDKYDITLNCHYSQLFLDNAVRLSDMWQAVKWIALTFCEVMIHALHAKQLYEKATVFI